MTSSPEGPGPARITAVITAHDRSRYLADAVRSAVEAGADELLVVRNFDGPIPGIGRPFEDLREMSPETGIKQAVGLERATGDLVGFLDDDDLWDREKGDRLRERWREPAPFDYYCHGQRPIDEAGQPVVTFHPEWARRQARAPSGERTTRELDFRLAHDRYWPGNNSSTVVARRWALPFSPWLRRAGWGCDTFWLVACYASAASGVLDPRALSSLRLHRANMSQTRGSDPAEFRRRHGEMARRFARATGTMDEMTKTMVPPGTQASMLGFLGSVAEGWRMFERLEAGSLRRSEAARFAFRPSALAGSRSTALLATLSDRLARWALYRSSVRRYRLGG